MTPRDIYWIRCFASGFSGTALNRPDGVAVDALGNVWVTNEGNDCLSVFVGAGDGFLSSRLPEGDVLASGDLIQGARGDRVTSRLVFHFKDGSIKDGSINDETSVFCRSDGFQKSIRRQLLHEGNNLVDSPALLCENGCARETA